MRFLIIGICILCLSGLVASHLFIQGSYSYQSCKDERQAEDASPNAEKHSAISIALACEARVITEHDALVTAIATIYIAIFTLFLGIATLYLWDTGEKQIRHVKDSSERQLRAYVGVDKSSSVPTHFGGGWNIVPSYEIEIRNFGQTPARDVVHLHAMSVAKLDLTRDPTINLPNMIPRASKSVIWPGSGAKAENSAEITLTPEQHSEIGDGNLALYVFGVITYIDVFGRSHTTRYVLEKSIRANNLHTQNLAPYEKYSEAT